MLRTQRHHHHEHHCLSHYSRDETLHHLQGLHQVKAVCLQYTAANFVFEVVQGSAKVLLYIKKTRKSRGG